MVGKHPGFDPSFEPTTRKKRVRRKKGDNREASTFDVRKLRTRDLKFNRNILKEFVRIDSRNTGEISAPVAAMRERLCLMSEELALRDARDAVAVGKNQDKPLRQVAPRKSRFAA
jgi:hypothetical protein